MLLVDVCRMPCCLLLLNPVRCMLPTPSLGLCCSLSCKVHSAMLLTSRKVIIEEMLYPADIIDFLCNTECVEGR